MKLEYLAPWLAALFYGGWAGYSNIEHGHQVIMSAFMVQGGFAFASTWLLTRFVCWLIHQQQPSPKPVVIFLICCFALLTIPAGIHLTVGTPNIVQAMLPGFIVGNIYVWLLIQRLVLNKQTVDG